MRGKQNLGKTITSTDEKVLFNKVIRFLEESHNLKYLGQSDKIDLEDLSGVKVDILSKGQYKFFDYTDGGIVEVFLYTYYNGVGKLACYIKTLVYR